MKIKNIKAVEVALPNKVPKTKAKWGRSPFCKGGHDNVLQTVGKQTHLGGDPLGGRYDSKGVGL